MFFKIFIGFTFKSISKNGSISFYMWRHLFLKAFNGIQLTFSSADQISMTTTALICSSLPFYFGFAARAIWLPPN